MNDLAKRFHKFWITSEDKGEHKGFFRLRERIPRIWVSYDELVEYIKSFPQGHKVFVQEFDENCEKGHTYRQIMGLEALDCDC
ncbi:MAG TPA: hypothetical protein ENH95_06300 [Nitrosopumilus sp.]|nr:hypothetical protein [Nitrosopumilus sp.]